MTGPPGSQLVASASTTIGFTRTTGQEESARKIHLPEALVRGHLGDHLRRTAMDPGRLPPRALVSDTLRLQAGTVFTAASRPSPSRRARAAFVAVTSGTCPAAAASPKRGMLP